MMVKNIYVIYDSKAGLYNTPFFMVNDQVALRSFTDLSQDKSTDVGRHPEDFTLFKVGLYDDVIADFQLFKPAETMCRAIEVCGAPPPQNVTTLKTEVKS